MVVEQLVRETIQPRRTAAVNWRVCLFDWLTQNTGSLETASYDCIRSYLLTLAPQLTDADIETELSFLAVQGIIRGREGALGGHYWSMVEDWQDSLSEPDEAPVVTVESPEPSPDPTEPLEEEVLAVEGMGDVVDLLQGDGLKQFVSLLLRRKGHDRVAEGATNPGNTALMEVWADSNDGAVLIAGCKGLSEIVRTVDVEEVLSTAAQVREQKAGTAVEVWMVGTGEWTPDAERLCSERNVKVVTTLELVREAFAHGVLGIGVRRMRPYIARIGEQGVFLDTARVKASCGDPTQVLGIK